MGVDLTTLHLGVNDVPYDYKGSEGQSTGDVAETLEAQYSIMQTFFEVHGQEIADALAEAAVGSLENILMGAPVANHPFIAGETEIQRMFGQFLDLKEMDGRAAGVPTRAALNGVNHRMKDPFAKRAERPSFIDTGLYQSSFRAWVDDK